jgi:hypothetical protein
MKIKITLIIILILNFEQIYSQIKDRDAEYVGGISKLQLYLTKNLDFNSFQNKNCSRILILLIIEKNGKPNFKSCPCEFKNIRTVVRRMPYWKPAIKNGKKIRSNFAYTSSWPVFENN